VRKFTAVVEKCRDTGLYVGCVPGFPGAHSQGAALEELAQKRLLRPREVVAALRRLGFVDARQRGSDLQMRHADDRATTLPMDFGATCRRS